MSSMEGYKFKTRVSKDGFIRIPEHANFFDQEVEVVIFPKQDVANKKGLAEEFIQKWAGFLNATDPDAAKFDYLSHKYK